MDIFCGKRRPPPLVRVLDADPDLARTLDPNAAGVARNALRARVAGLPKGRWEPQLWRETNGTLGLLVLEGALLRRVAVAQASSAELLGNGDLLRPWQPQGEGVPCTVTWEVLEPARVALLDAPFAASCARWPGLTAELVARAVGRSRWQASAAAISHVRRVDSRVLLLMWHVAERWGRVTPAGIVIPLRLTHERLALLVGAKRPSVSSALTRLVRRGLLVRRSDRSWMLTPAARAELQEVCAAPEAPPLARAA